MSVNSPPSIDGGSASSIARATRVELPALRPRKGRERVGERVSDRRMIDDVADRRVRRVTGGLPARVQFGNTSTRTSSRSWPGDDDVLRQVAEVRQQRRPQRADVDPRAGRELEVFGDASLEREAERGVARIDESDGVAHHVEPVRVERGLRERADRASSLA